MISFSNINKQYGKQLLFVDASFQLHPGEKVGLVGPNGAENRGQEGVKKLVFGSQSALALLARRYDLLVSRTCGFL